VNRIDRLTAIIIFLQGRKYVSVQELAELYRISERTVYRDLAALQEAGVPIGSEPGMGYFIVKGYHLPPVMFNRNEAASLLAGERLMQKWGNTEPGRSYLSALDKIRSILPPDDKEYFEVLDERIQIFHYHKTGIRTGRYRMNVFSDFFRMLYSKRRLLKSIIPHPTTRRKPTGKLNRWDCC